MNSDLLANLASATVRLALRALRIVAPDVLPRVLGSLVGRANVRAVDLGVASAVRDLGRSTSPIVPSRPANDVARLEAAFSSVLIEEKEPTKRIERIAASEPRDAARDAFIEAGRELGAKGWRRVLSEDPCSLCISWAEDGRVFAIEQKMRRHPHDGCTPELVT
jgi:hypothetical protein